MIADEIHEVERVVGIGEGETLVASDVAALVRHTQQVAYLEDGEIATLSATDFRTSTREARHIDRQATTLALVPGSVLCL